LSIFEEREKLRQRRGEKVELDEVAGLKRRIEELEAERDQLRDKI
jgi:hypothetical protein